MIELGILVENDVLPVFHTPAMDGTTTSDMQPTDESTTYLLSINPGMIAGELYIDCTTIVEFYIIYLTYLICYHQDSMYFLMCSV